MSAEALVGYIPGNHIGPVLTHDVAIPVAKKAAEIAGIEIDFEHILAGTEAYDRTDEHLPDSSVERIRQVDALVKAPIGGPPNSDEPKYKGVEAATILPIREKFAFVNLRPFEILGEAGVQISPLDDDLIRGTDAMVVRELTGDVYFGKKHSGILPNGERYAYETSYYTESQVVRAVQAAIKIASARGEDELMWVHKTNVLTETGALWRDVVEKLAAEAGIARTPYLHADAYGAALIDRPNTLGTAVMPNLPGDILTDVAAQITGSVGMGPSASLGKDGFGLYEPMGGAAWDIENPADSNPIGMIRSMAMMYRYTFDRPDIADLIDQASEDLINEYYLTKDLISPALRNLADNNEIDIKEVDAPGFTALLLDRMEQLAS